VFNPKTIGACISAIAISIATLSAAIALPVLACLPTFEGSRVKSVGQIPVPPLPSKEPIQSQSSEDAVKHFLAQQPLFGKTILVDPGHGGIDPGAIQGGVQEKDVVLNVSLLLRDKLEALGADVEMTRDSDVYPTLQERLDESNRVCADVFISVHGNSVANTAISGIETYYYDSRDKRLSDLLLHTVSSELHETAKWSNARNLFVLDGNNVPASLVEIGYLTNKRSRDLLKTPAYQDKVASALSDSLVTYLSDPTTERGCPA
jgi:N-acetylmuramoyl-L-alanine amidase